MLHVKRPVRVARTAAPHSRTCGRRSDALRCQTSRPTDGERRGALGPLGRHAPPPRESLRDRHRLHRTQRQSVGLEAFLRVPPVGVGTTARERIARSHTSDASPAAPPGGRHPCRHARRHRRGRGRRVADRDRPARRLAARRPVVARTVALAAESSRPRSSRLLSVQGQARAGERRTRACGVKRDEDEVCSGRAGSKREPPDDREPYRSPRSSSRPPYRSSSRPYRSVSRPPYRSSSRPPYRSLSRPPDRSPYRSPSRLPYRSSSRPPYRSSSRALRSYDEPPVEPGRAGSKREEEEDDWPGRAGSKREEEEDCSGRAGSKREEEDDDWPGGAGPCARRRGMTTAEAAPDRSERQTTGRVRWWTCRVESRGARG